MATSKDIAAALNVTEQTVRAYARDGVIPYTETPGKHRRFDLDEVLLALRLRDRSRSFTPLDFDRDDIMIADDLAMTPAGVMPERFKDIAVRHADSDEDFIDVQRLSGLLQSLQQGDIVDLARVATKFSPDTPMFPDEVNAIDHDEPVMTHEFAMASALGMIVSQDCDVQRSPEIEPYLIVAPLLELSEPEHERARPGLSSRYFALPRFEVADDDVREYLAVDLRILQSVEKVALLSDHMRRVACPLSQPRRDDLRRWLGMRFGRVPFPDDVQRQVVDKINNVVKQASRKAPTDRVIQAVVFMGLRWTPGKPGCELLVLTDARARAAHGVGEDEVRALQKRLIGGLGPTGDYVVRSVLRDSSEVSAADVFGFHEIALEIS